MIEVKKLVKCFGLKTILRGLDFSVQPVEFVALLGPSCACKTTFLRILATLSRPSLGQVQVAGYNIPNQAAEVRAKLGVVSHLPLLYPDLTAEENIRFYGRMYGIADIETRVTEVLQMVGIDNRVFRQQRLALRITDLCDIDRLERPQICEFPGGHIQAEDSRCPCPARQHDVVRAECRHIHIGGTDDLCLLARANVTEPRRNPGKRADRVVQRRADKDRVHLVPPMLHACCSMVLRPVEVNAGAVPSVTGDVANPLTGDVVVPAL